MVKRRRRPYRHRPLGKLSTVEIVNETPSFARAGFKANKAIGDGLRYELAGHNHLLDIYGPEYIPGPWFRYTTEDAPERKNFAQPDGLILRIKQGIITIVEFKWSHTPDAYYQLTDKYFPLVSTFFGTDIFEYRLLEICRWYNPQTAVPGKSGLRKDIETILPGEMGIHIWKP